MTDTVPAKTDLISGSITEGGEESNGIITWRLGTMNVGAGKTLQFKVKVKNDAQKGDQIINFADINCEEGVSQRISSPSLIVTILPHLDRVAITPQAITLTTGSTHQFTVTAYDQYDQMIPGVSYVWEVVTPTAGNITQTGLFTASSNVGSYPKVIKVTGTIDQKGLFTAGNTLGTYTDTIKVESSGKVAYATVIVVGLPSVLTNLEVSRTSITLTVNTSFQLKAIAYDQYGKKMKNVFLKWEANKKAGTVDQSGLFKAGTKAGL